MEFKGTSGKWYVYHNSQGYNSFSINSKYKVVPIEEMKANALLISKAPEMLEMLQKAKVELSRIKGSMMAHPDCTEGSEFDDYTDSAEEIENEIEQIIKQATEL